MTKHSQVGSQNDRLGETKPMKCVPTVAGIEIRKLWRFEFFGFSRSNAGMLTFFDNFFIVIFVFSTPKNIKKTDRRKNLRLTTHPTTHTGSRILSNKQLY